MPLNGPFEPGTTCLVFADGNANLPPAFGGDATRTVLEIVLNSTTSDINTNLDSLKATQITTSFHDIFND